MADSESALGNMRMRQMGEVGELLEMALEDWNTGGDNEPDTKVRARLVCQDKESSSFLCFWRITMDKKDTVIVTGTLADVNAPHHRYGLF